MEKVKGELETNADELNSYRKKNKIFNLSEESSLLSEKLTNYDLEKETLKESFPIMLF